MTSISINRTVLVRASRETVFRFFTDPERFAAWFGEGSAIEARVGGPVQVAFPGGATAVGEVLAVDPPGSISFTWGYPREGSPLPPGSSTVTVELESQPEGTLVALRHEVPSTEMREAHEAGWRHHLSHLAALAADGRRAEFERAVAAWTDLWRRDLADRSVVAGKVLAPQIQILDALGTLEGIDDVVGHIDNANAHLPAVTWEAAEDLQTVGDRATWGWRMRHDDHGIVGTGRYTARIDLEGQITEIVGYWDDHPDEVSRRVHGLLPPSDDAGLDSAEQAALEPHLWTDQLEDTAAWYAAVLGFVEDARYPADGKPTWIRLRRGDVALMLASPPASPPDGTQAYAGRVPDRLDHGGPIALYIHSDDPDADLARVQARGVEPIEPIWDPWWGGRQFTVEAPNGVWWTIRRD